MYFFEVSLTVLAGSKRICMKLQAKAPSLKMAKAAKVEGSDLPKKMLRTYLNISIFHKVYRMESIPIIGVFSKIVS